MKEVCLRDGEGKDSVKGGERRRQISLPFKKRCYGKE